MGLINSIGAYFNKFLGGWTFGTQTDQLTMKNSAEIVGTTGTIYEHTFQNKNGIVAHLDDITITLPTDTTGSILFLNALNEFDSDGVNFNWDKINKRLGVGITTPLATIHAKGDSDSIGNIFIAENLTNTVNLTLSNSGILTLGLPTVNLTTNLSVQNDLLYFDTVNNRIGIGTSTPQATLSIRSQGTSNRRGILVEHSDNVTAFSQSKFIGARSRGSHGSPSAVLNNDSLVSFNAVGYKATGWSDTLGGMYVYAAGNFTDVSTPTYITFRGVASGTSVSEWLRLSPILTHTFTDTDYSAIDTGYSIQFKRTTNTGLRLGTVATFTTTYNSSSNVSVLQAQHSNSASVLKIAPYGGAVHIGSRNSNVVIGSVTDNADSTGTVIISGGDTSYVTPNLHIAPRGTANGLKIWGYGNDGSYFGSQLMGEGNTILFKNQVVYVGYSSPYAGSTSPMTTSRFEINVAHRTMADNTPATSYQRVSYIKGSADADRYSYMMIGSHALSTMGMQMKVSADAVTFTNGNITLNPFGGNVGVGIATAPTANLHVKGNSDSVGSVLKLESLSNNILEVYNTRDVLFGGGTLSADTQVEINPYRAAGTSNYVFRVNAQGTNNYMRFVNSNTNTDGGLQISRTSYADFNALTISGGGTTGLTITATGIVNFGQASAIIPAGNPLIGRDSTNTAILHTNNGNEGKFVFQNVNDWAFNSTKGMFVVRKNLTDATVATVTQQMFEIDGTFNLTNGTKNLIGINYNPTITALSGSHYGFLIRPNTLNGIGLDATLPTANLQINHNTNNTLNLLIQRSGTNIFAISNGGASNTHNFITYAGGAAYGYIGAEDSGGVFSYKIEGLLQNTTNGISAGIVFRTTGTSNGGSPSFLFQNATTVNYATYAGVVKPALIRLQGTHGAASGSGEYAAIRISTTINQTGGTGINYGIIYEPTITSITGAHYGLVIRPNGTLNGIGHTTNLPTTTWHIKGSSDSVGSSFRVENLSNSTYLDFANSGLVTQNVGAGGSNKEYHFWRDGGTNVFSLAATAGQLGLWFRNNSAASINVEQNNVYLKGTISSSNTASSNAAISFQNATAPTLASDVYYDFGLFGKTYTAVANANVKVLRIREDIRMVTSGTGSYTFFENAPTINQTGGTAAIIGYNYNPTLTSILGAHYGILVRPNTLNGFGLGATLPTSALDIQHTNGYTQFRLRTQYTPTSSADANGSQGDICFDDAYVYYKASTGWVRGALATF